VLFSQFNSNNKNRQVLVDGVNSDKIPHALLFFGPSESGKLAHALAYIQYIFCLDKKNNDSCGVCSNCLKNGLLMHPDVHYIFPVASSKNNQKPVSADYLELWKKNVLKSGDLNLETWTEIISKDKKNLVIYVQEIYELEKKINLKSYQGEYKVFLIWNANKLNTQASNKLLKSLEEPPTKTLFILISESKEELITTVLSRLISIKFQPNNNSEKTISESKHMLFAETFVEWVRLCFNANKKNKINDLVDLVEKIASMNRTKQLDFLNYVTENFRKSFLYNYSLKNQLYLDIPHENFSVERFSCFVHRKNIFLIFNKIEESMYYITRNANSKLLFLDLSLTLSKLIYKENKVENDLT
tara:strand:- start:233 stop:1303 length:1071 start_codon:yes stop_codon:yes gene_type:complete